MTKPALVSRKPESAPRGIMRTPVLIAASLLVTAAAGPSRPPLTPDGWGEVRIGMSEQALAARFHVAIPPDDDADSEDCRQFEWPAAGPDVWVMTEKGRVTRITIDGKSRLKTAKGVGIGSREAAVRRLYGPRLTIATAAYLDEPAHDLTFWVDGRKRRGILFETDEHGRVTDVRVGSRSIRYIEGCL